MVVTIWIAWIILMFPVRLRAGQIVDEFGTYRSPQRQYGITVAQSPDNIVRVTFTHRTTRYWFLTSFVDGVSHDFEAEREWFACFDEYDRLWLFVGKWDPQWGDTRRLPSGGYKPHIQGVILEGFWFGQSRVLGGGNVVSSTGDWAGVPREFFDRIPDRHGNVWGENPALPDSPPPLTENQKQAAEAWLAQRR
jgi:hypothetical protein